MKAEEILAKHWEKATKTPFDDCIKKHMKYAIDAVQEALELKSDNSGECELVNGAYYWVKVDVYLMDSNYQVARLEIVKNYIGGKQHLYKFIPTGTSTGFFTLDDISEYHIIEPPK